MFVEILITVGFFILYCLIAMCIHHHCDRQTNNDPNHILVYNDEFTNEYSLIE